MGKGKVFLNGNEVTIVEIVDQGTERVAVRDSEGGFTNVVPTELTGDVSEEFDRLHYVDMCLANLLNRLHPTDGTPGSELERYRKKLLDN